VRNFKAVEHRLEFVIKLRAWINYNDSKATNVDATIKALESFPANIHLIWRKDKGSDYTVLNELRGSGEAGLHDWGRRREIEGQIQGRAEIEHAKRWRTRCGARVNWRWRAMCAAAPACASFDQFQSYEHRGRVF